MATTSESLRSDDSAADAPDHQAGETPLGFEEGDRGAGRPRLPSGRSVHLPGRGTTYVREVAGPSGAPTVFLLHGWTVSGALNWFPVYEPLGAVVRVVSLDHRGHGQGIRSRERFRLTDAADDVVALADELGIDRFVVAGYSMGGTIAQLVTHRHPDRVRGMVLAATWSNQPRRSHQTRLLKAAGPVGRSMRRLPVDRQHAMFEWGYQKASGRESEPTPTWFVNEVRAGSVSAMLEAGGELARFDSRPWLGGVEVPTGIAITTRDTLVSPTLQHRLAALLPHAKLRTIPIDHDGCVSQADLFRPAFVDLVSHAAGLN